MTTWEYRGKPLEEVPEGADGFVYLITFKDGDFYVGRKNFYSVRRVKVKGRVNRKKVVKESDWKSYGSSSKIVKERIEEGEAHSKVILHLCACKACTFYYEVYEQILRDVLCDPKALNANILTKMFSCSKPMKL